MAELCRMAGPPADTDDEIKLLVSTTAHEIAERYNLIHSTVEGILWANAKPVVDQYHGDTLAQVGLDWLCARNVKFRPSLGEALALCDQHPAVFAPTGILCWFLGTDPIVLTNRLGLLQNVVSTRRDWFSLDEFAWLAGRYQDFLSAHANHMVYTGLPRARFIDSSSLDILLSNHLITKIPSDYRETPGTESRNYLWVCPPGHPSHLEYHHEIPFGTLHGVVGELFAHNPPLGASCSYDEAAVMSDISPQQARDMEQTRIALVTLKHAILSTLREYASARLPAVEMLQECRAQINSALDRHQLSVLRRADRLAVFLPGRIDDKIEFQYWPVYGGWTSLMMLIRDVFVELLNGRRERTLSAMKPLLRRQISGDAIAVNFDRVDMGHSSFWTHVDSACAANDICTPAMREAEERFRNWYANLLLHWDQKPSTGGGQRGFDVAEAISQLAGKLDAVMNSRVAPPARGSTISEVGEVCKVGGQFRFKPMDGDVFFLRDNKQSRALVMLLANPDVEIEVRDLLCATEESPFRVSYRSRADEERRMAAKSTILEMLGEDYVEADDADNQPTDAIMKGDAATHSVIDHESSGGSHLERISLGPYSDNALKLLFKDAARLRCEFKKANAEDDVDVAKAKAVEFKAAREKVESYVMSLADRNGRPRQELTDSDDHRVRSIRALLHNALKKVKEVSPHTGSNLDHAIEKSLVFIYHEDPRRPWRVSIESRAD